MTVQSSDGCENTVYSLVHVKDDLQIFIPNAFTPDGSGFNDTFEVHGVGFSTYNMRIYDRWGQMVYSSGDGMKGWDGSHIKTGNAVQQGLYIYDCVITDQEGGVHTRTGMVTLLR